MALATKIPLLADDEYENLLSPTAMDLHLPRGVIFQDCTINSLGIAAPPPMSRGIPSITTTFGTTATSGIADITALGGSQAYEKVDFSKVKDALLALQEAAILILADTSTTRKSTSPNVQRAYFYDRIAQFEKSGDVRSAMEHVAEHIDALLNADDFDECDFLLGGAPVEAFSDGVLVAFLGVTLAARDKLKLRSNFYKRAFRLAQRQRGVDWARNLLDRYR